MRGLEQLLGVKLYHRQPHGFAATRPGERFARDLGVALREIDQARDELALANGAANGRVAVGCLPLTPKTLLARALGRLIQRWPNVEVSVEESSYAALQLKLAAGEIDMLVGALRNSGDADVQEQGLFDDPYLIVARAGHLFSHTTVNLLNFSQLRWVAAVQGTPRREALEFLFSTLPCRPIILLETSSLDMAMAALYHSDCLTLVSQSLLKSSELDLKILGQLVMQRTRIVGVTTRLGAPQPDGSRSIEQSRTEKHSGSGLDV